MSPISRPRYSGQFASVPIRSAARVIRAMGEHSVIIDRTIKQKGAWPKIRPGSISEETR